MKQNRTRLFEVDGLQVQLIQKDIKNMYLRYKGESDTVLVSAPFSMRERDIVHFIRERREWIADAKQRWQERSEEKPEMTKEEAWKAWVYLKEEIQKLLNLWAPQMGVIPGGFKIRQMKTRWGSCNVRTHHMTFNLALAHVPYECLEYVVVHELSHLIEPSHNERFWRTMETYLPDAKLRRKKLKGYSV